mgnify:CR=1 FL=1
MPKNRYDPLLFLPYSLSVACQEKTTPEPSGPRLSFETHRTGEFRKRPTASKSAGFYSVQAQCRYHFGLPLEGVAYSRVVNLSCMMSCRSCCRMYFFIVASLSPTVLT